MYNLFRRSCGVQLGLRACQSLQPQPYTLARAMSSGGQNAPARHKFIVYAPDMSDEGAFQRRLSVRQSHLDNATTQARNGVVKVGGAMLTPDSIVPGAEKKMVGSVFICEAESLESVRNLMENDVYYTNGVWDKEKLVILPLALAIADLPTPA